LPSVFPVESLAVSRWRADVLFLIDEIEKPGGSDHSGRLTSGLLTMLEPETSRAYPDKYFDAPPDISHLSSIARANSEGLPGPLRDRLRIRMPMSQVPST
jgi:ATP-dependent Lon protease